MSTLSSDPVSRRLFVRFLAGSPLLAAAGFNFRMLQQEPDLIAAAHDALNVFDFEPVARKKLPPAHWGYLATGTDDDATIRANRDGYAHFDIRPRRLVDVSHIDTSVQLLGTRWDTPIVLCPVG